SGGHLRETLWIESTLRRAAAEVAAADLPDQVAAVFKVIAGDSALAGVVGKTAGFRAAVERQYRVGRQRAEAHRRNIEQRRGIGLPAVPAADVDARLVFQRRYRHRAVCGPLIAGIIDVAMSAERPGLEIALGALVDQRAVFALDRVGVQVALDQILLNLGPDVLDQIAEVTDRSEEHTSELKSR